MLGGRHHDPRRLRAVWHELQLVHEVGGELIGSYCLLVPPHHLRRMLKVVSQLPTGGVKEVSSQEFRPGRRERPTLNLSLGILLHELFAHPQKVFILQLRSSMKIPGPGSVRIRQPRLIEHLLVVIDQAHRRDVARQNVHLAVQRVCVHDWLVVVLNVEPRLLLKEGIQGKQGVPLGQGLKVPHVHHRHIWRGIPGIGHQHFLVIQGELKVLELNLDAWVLLLEPATELTEDLQRFIAIPNRKAERNVFGTGQTR